MRDVRLTLVLAFGSLSWLINAVGAPREVAALVTLVGIAALAVATWRVPMPEPPKARRRRRRRRLAAGPLVWFLVGRWTAANRRGR